MKKKKTAAPDGPAIWGELVVGVFRLNSLFLALGNEIARPAGQTSARWQVLASAYNASQTVPAIARRMGLTRQSVQRIADLLVKDGLAEYAQNEEHKKSPLLGLTSRGRGAMERIAKEQRVWANGWSKEITQAELARTLKSLQKIESICQSSRPANSK